ncbi:MAG: heme lyase CcmF/NrfE family subunit [Chloroflexi bacterium]|nr:heme lyase CcmF/NrfE family subunit [Chloroflexota bacterium]
MAVSDIGFVALVLALLAAAYVLVAAPLGHRLGAPELVVSARNAVMAVAGLMLVALAVLAYSFVNHDFGVNFVASNSKLAQPWYFTAAAIYGGQAGSLLVWATGLSVFSALAVWLNRRRLPDVMPYTMATMMFVQVFFLVILVFLTNPFERLPFDLADGRGLNALLRDPGFLIHPPFLLMGFMAWTIPFAFAMGALMSGRLDSRWLVAARPWVLAAWAILGVGLLLGAWWAYHVLGWGGYWGWDPVENVALLPWLTGTAFLHSIMVEERRGMLRKWNMLLILITFSLAIFGTFVVRGGLLASVHNFATSALGPAFLSFLGVVVAVSLFWYIKRQHLLTSTQRFDSILSKESGFLLNNVLLVGVAFATFWGTIFPLLTEAFDGSRITVGPPFYQQVNGPILLALLVLMGIGPLLAWRKASWASIRRNFRLPLAGAFVWAIVMVTVLDVSNLWTLAAVDACAFVFGVVMLEYYRGVRARRRATREAYPQALVNLVSRNRQRYGGYIVHLSILLIALGVIGVNLHQKDFDVTLAVGESASIGDYTLTYRGIDQRRGEDSSVTEATLVVFRGGKQIDVVHPGRVVYDGQESQPTSRIAIRSNLREDLYVVLAAWDDEVATFLMFVNPLVIWLWIGGGLFVFGTLVAVWPQRQPAREVAPVRAAPDGAVSEE